MIDALWSAFQNPGIIVGRDGAPTLVLLAGVAALVTLGFMVTIGQRLATRRPIIAALMGGAFVPLLMNTLAIVVALAQPAGTDGGGILVFAALLLSICVLPVTAATSVLYVVLRRSASRSGASKRVP